MKTLMTSCLGLLLLVGCAFNPPARILTAVDSGREVSIQTGQVFLIELPSNHSTGFSWSDRSEPGQVLTLVGPAGYMEDTKAGMVGVTGKETWQFRATQAGQQTLQLVYSRPWEKDIAPAKTVTFNVVVTGK